MKPGIKAKFARRVKPDVRSALRRACAALGAVIDVRHPIRVGISTYPSIAGDDGKAVGFGMFSWDTMKPPRMPIHIYLAGGMADFLERDHAVPRDEAVAAVVHTLAHELVHYEQWRDGRPSTERGVNLRARNLVRKASL